MNDIIDDMYRIQLTHFVLKQFHIGIPICTLQMLYDSIMWSSDGKNCHGWHLSMNVNQAELTNSLFPRIYCCWYLTLFTLFNFKLFSKVFISQNNINCHYMCDIDRIQMTNQRNFHTPHRFYPLLYLWLAGVSKRADFWLMTSILLQDHPRYRWS